MGGVKATAASSDRARRGGRPPSPAAVSGLEAGQPIDTHGTDSANGALVRHDADSSPPAAAGNL